MVQIKIQRPSSGVLSRMRNGHPVRVKPHIDGEGMAIEVHPETYDSWTHAFKKGKAIQWALKPEEIKGSGLGGKLSLGKVMKGVEKVAKSPAGKKIIKKVSDVVMKHGEKALDNYLDSKSGGEGLYAQPHGRGLGGAIDLQRLNELTGQKMGMLSHANRGIALAGLENDKIAHGLATARGQHGSGLYAQAHAHPMGRSPRTEAHRLHEMGSVGKMGNLMTHGSGLPAALLSQPQSQNFQWGSRLPVAYQHISQTGRGLY